MIPIPVTGVRRLGVASVLLGVVLAPGLSAQDGEPEIAAEAAIASTPAIAAVAENDPAVRPAEIRPRASRSLLLDGVRTEAGMFVVGERGHILTSEDGQAWRQLEVPTRSTLTTVTAAEGQLWAAGHDGQILHSADHGKTWQRRRLSVWTPDLADPTEGVPVLDLLFTDARNGYAIGAYNLLLRTHDGGETWAPSTSHGAVLAAADTDGGAEAGADWGFSDDDLALGAESDPHLNAIARTGSGALVITGERGTFLRSRDGGETWENQRLPYEGSMFGVLAWQDDHILVFGLRGNVYESRDLGDHWTRVETGISTSLMGGTALADGGAILVGVNGAVLQRQDASSAFRSVTHTTASGETPLLAGVLPVDDGRFLLIGDKGADLYRPE